MDDIFKPCPLCGEDMYAEVCSTRKDDFDGHCTNKKCALYRIKLLMVNKKTWNTRPIEDALRARAEKAEAMVERLIEAGDNHIHMAIASVRQQDQYYALVAEWQASKDGGEK